MEKEGKDKMYEEEVLILGCDLETEPTGLLIGCRVRTESGRQDDAWTFVLST